MIVVNTTFKYALWADALFAMDKPWWDKYWLDVDRDFLGQSVSTIKYPKRESKIQFLSPPFNAGGNSGAGACALAIFAGATRIILLGYDARRINGKVHHHGDHPKGLGNAGGMKKWPEQFSKLKVPPDVIVINCSQGSALTCFPIGDLDHELSS